MPKLTNSKLPKYLRVASRNRGFYWKDGKRVYLPGLYNSPESLKAYKEQMDLIFEERLSEKTEPQTITLKTNQLTVAELVAAFLKWGETYYVKNGKPTGTNEDHELASRPLVELYGNFKVDKITQLELIAIQEFLVTKGLSRKHLNARIGRIKRIFNWGTGRGIISHDVAGRLKFVENLKKGRTKAREAPKPKPVADSVVEATLPHLSPVVADMVQIHRVIGSRPDEVCSMTWNQIDNSDDIWIYCPGHKMDYRDILKALPLGKKCQAILERYKDTPPDQIIFSPKRTMRERAEKLAEKRAVGKNKKIQPSQIERKKYKQVRGEN